MPWSSAETAGREALEFNPMPNNAAKHPIAMIPPRLCETKVTAPSDNKAPLALFLHSKTMMEMQSKAII
jgi:hypothetical protein